MSKVYVLVEERETSVACRICGIWSKRKKACDAMLHIVKNNNLYTENSKIDIVKGMAESDPNYCDEEYCNYSIEEYPVL